ncbi:MAG: acyltransferase [Candidatus Paceibacterota bacterium]|jgi:peptidoglycan/LPS O-acetylase OafA/YrhL
MPIQISNSIQSTYIFISILIIGIILTFRKKTTKGLSVNLTQELKGFAILTIVFAHIGYYLVSDNQFLFPLTIAAGVGVNLFLFLSGYGLAVSAMSKETSIPQFYLRRLPKLYIPMWCTVFFFLILDFFLLDRIYSLSYIGQTLLGFFPRADLFLDINSPLWYFTLIIFYYLLFPITFYRKKPWLSGIFLLTMSYLVVLWNPAFLNQVTHLYKLHVIAFPLGVFIASLVFKYKDRLKEILQKTEYLKLFKKIIYWCFVGLLIWIISYTAYHSNVGNNYWLEQATSILTCGAIIILFLISKLENRLLYLFGVYSYEIYLIHWPLMSRFDIFYQFLPSWLATLAYLGIFVAISWFIKKCRTISTKKV